MASPFLRVQKVVKTDRQVTYDGVLTVVIDDFYRNDRRALVWAKKLVG